MATYNKIGLTTGDNVRIRKTASTSGASVTQVPDSGTLILTSGSTSSGSGYTWYYLSCEVDGAWHTGYMVSDYVNVLDESIAFSSNGYSSGKTLRLSWSSVYAQYVDVSYVLSDSLGNTFYPSGNSYTIDLSQYYTAGQYITFTLTASYSYNTGTTSVVFSKSNVNAYCYVTYIGPTVSTPSAPTVTLSNGTFNVTWNPCTGANGSGNVSYQVVYGDSENGSTAYTSSSTTSTSMALARWVVPTWNDITYSFYIRATYSGITRSSSTTTYVLTAPSIAWSNTALMITQLGNQIQVSWSPALINNNYNGENIQYSLVCQIRGNGYDGTEYTTTVTETSHTFDPPAYDQELFVQITAWANNVSGSRYSDGEYFTASSTPSHYTIRCYLNGSWQDCIVKYYDGLNWIECITKYYNGSQWQDCSF